MLIIILYSLLNIKANTINILTSDRTVTPQKINRVIESTGEDFKYHLEIIKSETTIDPQIMKEIKGLDKYKLIVVDPTNKKIKQQLTKKLNAELDFSKNTPTLKDLTKIPGLSE